MPKIKPVCKDCDERHPGCHDTCGRYLEAKDEYYAKKNAIYREKAAESEFLSAVLRKKK